LDEKYRIIVKGFCQDEVSQRV